LSPAARAYLAAIGISKLDDCTEHASLIWLHALAIGYSPAYLTENADGIRRDWPRIPLPEKRKTLEQSAELDQAAAAYEDVIKSDPKHAAAQHRLAIVCDKQGKCGQAMTFSAPPTKSRRNCCDFGYSLYLRTIRRGGNAPARFRAAGLTRAHNNLACCWRTGRVGIHHFRRGGSPPRPARMRLARCSTAAERARAVDGRVDNRSDCAVAGQR
jgi:hypothetical protein